MADVVKDFSNLEKFFSGLAPCAYDLWCSPPPLLPLKPSLYLYFGILNISAQYPVQGKNPIHECGINQLTAGIGRIFWHVVL